MKLAGPLFVVAIAMPASADIAVPGDYPKLTVAVGKTVEQNVQKARGRWFCDDPSILSADLVTRGDSNIWIVTGKQVGSTQCRIGDQLTGPSIVFNVYVVEKKS
ncbi:MAG: hypothetical protein QM831_05645 [Kofleriaceae bacterium]